MAELIEFKSGVVFHVLTCDQWLWDAMARSALCAPPLHGGVMTVTSISDSGHSEKSCHYIGRAFDVRFRGTRRGAINVLPVEQEASALLWAERIHKLLGKDWDVVVEIDHIHVEYDPK